MTRRLILPSALLLTFLAGCSSSAPQEDTTTPPADDPQAAACESFYAGTGTPLAERAEAARSALSGGEVVDSATYSEVNVLEQRITELAAGAPESVASLLGDINAPFTEAVTSYNDAMAQGEEPELPDFTTIDVSGSTTAQEELDSTCEVDAA